MGLELQESIVISYLASVIQILASDSVIQFETYGVSYIVAERELLYLSL